MESTPIEPDLALIFGDGAQMTMLIHAATWHTGERLSVETAAEAGTCGEGIAATYILNEPTIAFPCHGTRSFGLADDDEIIMGVPAWKMEELMDGLVKRQAARPYPIRQAADLTPRPPSLYGIRREPPPV